MEKIKAPTDETYRWCCIELYNIDSIQTQRNKPFKRHVKSHLHLLALLGAHHILHISRIRVKGHFNSLNAELNPICHLLALLGARHILHVSRIWVKGHFNPLNAE